MRVGCPRVARFGHSVLRCPSSPQVKHFDAVRGGVYLDNGVYALGGSFAAELELLPSNRESSSWSSKRFGGGGPRVSCASCGEPILAARAGLGGKESFLRRKCPVDPNWGASASGGLESMLTLYLLGRKSLCSL